VLLGSEKRQRDKDKKLKYKRIDDFKKVIRMVQRNFIDSWLLPCLLRSHRSANPRQKMGFAIFRLCLPTTLIQVSETMEVRYNTENQYIV